MDTDYVIIGAGTAGCILAYKLSKRFNVTLIEAGPFYANDPNINNPTKSLEISNDPNRYFYNLGPSLTEGNNGAPKLPLFFYPSTFSAVMGRLVGGSSSVNGMQVVRGTRRYFQDLARRVSDQDWGYDNVLLHFTAMESFKPSKLNENSSRGTRGKLSISQLVASSELAKLFSKSCSELYNIPYNIDYNDMNNELGSFEYWQLTIAKNKRVTSANSFLSNLEVNKKDDNTLSVKSKSGRNITLMTRSTVRKITLNSKNVAKSVEILTNGENKTIRARKGVILCAGLNSNTLLQLSGIGDRASLQEMKIPCLVNSPNVGRHIKNHPILILLGVGKSFKTENPDGLYSGGVFLADPSKNDKTRSFEIAAIANQEGGITLFGINLRAESEGWMSIQSNDPLQAPIYDYKYYDNQADVKSMIELYIAMYDIIVKMGLSPIDVNGSVPNPVDGIEPIQKYVLTNYSQAYHWTGMTRMAMSKKDGVVDNNCRVFGTQNLYVADCGIFPTNPLGNTQMPAYLAGSILASKLLNA